DVALITQVRDNFRRVERKLERRSISRHPIRYIVKPICHRLSQVTDTGPPVANCVRTKVEKAAAVGQFSAETESGKTFRTPVIIEKGPVHDFPLDWRSSVCHLDWRASIMRLQQDSADVAI